ncbi:MAG: transcriptional regulator [Acidobacteria bacterium]|nr:transcriptional regulator [Acidobacteriota bacterium]
MSEPVHSDELLILVSRCYYIDNLPQAQIAKLVNVSQSKISRMLSMARERGLVRVSVPEYQFRSVSLEREFRQRFNIDAVVVRTAAGVQSADLRQSLGYFAGPVAAKWIAANGTIAVAGGRAMQALIEHMRPQAPEPSVTIVQAMGNIDSCPGSYDAVELGRTLARRWQGRFLTLNAPGILPDEDTCRQFLELDPIKSVTEHLRRATTTFVGIGTLDNSVFVERKVLGPREIEVLRAAGGVGEMLGRFYDAAGDECATQFRNRVVSVQLDHIRHLPQVVAVVSGADRSAAVQAAIRGGLIKRLIVDEGGASAILGKAQAYAR